MPAHNVLIDIEKADAVGDTTNVSFGGNLTVGGATIHTGGDKTLAVVVPNANTTILAADSGKIHHIANVSTDRTFTLPAAAAGLYYEFWATLVAADGNSWIIVADHTDDFLKGGLIWFDSNAGSSGTEVALASPDGSTDHQLTVPVPGVGTRIMYYSDGTNWFISGVVLSTTIPTFT